MMNKCGLFENLLYKTYLLNFYKLKECICNTNLAVLYTCSLQTKNEWKIMCNELLRCLGTLPFSTIFSKGANFYNF